MGVEKILFNLFKGESIRVVNECGRRYIYIYWVPKYELIRPIRGRFESEYKNSVIQPVRSELVKGVEMMLFNLL